MKAKIIGFTLLTLSEILSIYLIFFDNYFPKWQHVYSFIDSKQLVYEHMELIINSSITITSLIGGLLLMLSSNSFKFTIKVYGVTILLLPFTIGILSVFNIMKDFSLSDILGLYLAEFFLTFPFLIIFLFFAQFINKKVISAKKKKKYISFSLLFLLVIIITSICVFAYDPFSPLLLMSIIIFILVLWLNVILHKLKPDNTLIESQHYVNE